MADDPNVTVVDAEASIVVPASVPVDAIPLAGEPATDKAFSTPSGTRFRARIVRIAEQETRAPVNGTAAIAASGVTLSLSLALLDADMSVARDGNGDLLIMDRHELLFSDEAMKNPNFEPQAAIDSALAQQAHLLEVRMGRRKATDDCLAQWAAAAPLPTSSPAALSEATETYAVGDLIQSAAKEMADAQTKRAVAEAVAAERARLEAGTSPAADVPASTDPVPAA